MAESPTFHGPPAEIAWRRNELVLDTIFNLLPITDLQNIRLTCKFFAQAAGRVLARKAVVHLTDWTFAGQNAIAEFPGAFDLRPQTIRVSRQSLKHMWECECERSKRKIRYFSIDHDSFSKTISRSDFRPKKIVLLGYTCALSVAATFNSVEELEVRTHTGPQEEQLMARVAAATLFPNLKVLRFRDIIPHTQVCPSANDPEDEIDGDMFCSPFWDIAKRDCRLIFASKLDQWCPIYRSVSVDHVASPELVQSGTSGPPVSGTSFKSPLSQLSVQMSPHCSDRDLAVLKCFPKLEVLEVLWWRVEAMWWGGHQDPYPDASYPDECLEKMLPHILACTSIKRLVLRMYLFCGNMENVQSGLNELKMPHLSLQLVGCPQYDPQVELPRLVAFFTGLEGHVVQAMDTLHFTLRMRQSAPRDLSPLFRELHRKGFFQKPKWKVILHFPLAVWIRLEKRCDGLIFQMSNAGKRESLYQQLDFESLVPYMNPENKYNYAFHQVKSINDFENLNSSALYRPYFLSANWTCMERLICDECRAYPRLLCDLPGFRQEAKLPCPEEHPQEAYVRTWIFSSVPRHLLAKWTLQLVSEIAAWKSKKTCNCESCWDVVTRFKKIYAFQFTDADCVRANQLEAMDSSWYTQLENGRWPRERPREPTLASFGFIEDRSHIFLPRHVQPQP